MAAVLEELINNLYEIVQDAWSVPLGGDKCVIERDKVLDILDELRECLPADLKMAREIVEKRNDFLAAGRKEGEAIKRQAEEHARQLVSEHDIVVEARRKSAEIVANADRKSRELRRVTSEYCEELLKSTEESVSSTLEDAKKARAKFRSLLK